WQMNLKKVSCEPGHTQCASSFTRVNSAQRMSLGQVTLISNEDFGAATWMAGVPTLTVPVMNFGNTSTLPGISELFSVCAMAGAARPTLRAARNSTRIHFMVLLHCVRCEHHARCRAHRPDEAALIAHGRGGRGLVADRPRR